MWRRPAFTWWEIEMLGVASYQRDFELSKLILDSIWANTYKEGCPIQLLPEPDMS